MKIKIRDEGCEIYRHCSFSRENDSKSYYLSYTCRMNTMNEINRVSLFAIEERMTEQIGSLDLPATYTPRDTQELIETTFKLLLLQ